MPALASFYDHSSLVSSLTYGNGSTKSYVYDDQQRIKQTYVDNTLTSLYNYDRLGNLVKYSDAKTGLTWNHEYDLIGRATRSDASDGRYIGYTYDSFNRLYTVKENVRGYELKTVYDYDDQCNYSEKSGLVTGLTMNNCRQFVYSYDKLNRLTSKTLLKSYGVKTTYSYLEGAGENTTTALIKSVNNDGELLEYAYDENGNITSIKKNGALLESYEYDALSQLTKVTRGSEVYTYTYDNAGNILSVKKNGTVINTYGYSDPEWKDLLTSFNGQTITYDAIGNPLTYRDGMTMTWQSGRQLASINKDGLSATFAYDANGHRTQKTVNGVTTNYYWVGDRLQYMATGDDLLVFLYDDKGTPYGMFTVLDGVQQYFFYLYNAQGDVIAIIDDYAERVVNYEYSAWGELLSVTGSKADTVGVLNPFRYRGYCYDTETGLYYVSSRYYDPEVGRWINADSQLNTSLGVLGYNTFAYCLSNPINKADYSGNKPGDLFDTMDEAARDFAEYINANSIEENREYASYIYSKTRIVIAFSHYETHRFLWFTWKTPVYTKVKKTQYSYRKPNRGTNNSSAVPKNPFGWYNQVAILHTHAAFDPNYYNDVFSETDINLAKRAEMPIYVATPLGTLRRYNPSNDSDIIIFDDIPFDPNHPGRKLK